MNKTKMNSNVNAIKYIYRTVIIGTLVLVLRIFFVNVFKNFYTVDVQVPLAREKIIVGFIMLIGLLAILVVSKTIWQENKVLTLIANITQQIMIIILLFLILSGVGAVLGTGMLSNSIVFTCSLFTVYKTYWTDSQLLEFCGKELKNLNAKNLGIDISKTVTESDHNLDRCKELLQEEIKKAELVQKEKQSIKSWILWILGIQIDPETNSWKTTKRTWKIIGVGVVGLLTVLGVNIFLDPADFISEPEEVEYVAYDPEYTRAYNQAYAQEYARAQVRAQEREYDLEFAKTYAHAHAHTYAKAYAKEYTAN